MSSILNSLFLALGVGLLLISSSASSVSSMTKQAQAKTFLRPPQAVKSFHLGYNEILADSYWIRLIQDFGECDKPRMEVVRPDHQNLDQILSLKDMASSCPDSWVYHMADFVTELAPRFEYAYQASSLNLLVSVDDLQGGAKILEKGISRFPRNWRLPYSASYLYLYELKDVARAADLLIQAHQNGGPKWLPVLASRLYSKLDSDVLAKAVLTEYIKTSPGGEAEERARKRLKELTGSDRLPDEN